MPSRLPSLLPAAPAAVLPPRRPWRVVPSALALGLLLAAAAGPAWAQSLLSEPAVLWQQQGPAQDALFVPPELAAMTAGELLGLVDLGGRPGLFAALQDKLEPALAQAQAEGRDVLALHRLLLIYLLRAGQADAPPEALEKHAQTFVDLYPDSDDFPLAFYYLNMARARQGKTPQESFFFDDFALAELSPAQQSDYLLMLANAAEQQGDPMEAAWQRIREMETQGTQHRTLIPDILEELRKLPNEDLLLDFMDRYAVDRPWLARQEPFLRLQVLLNAGRVMKADDLLYFLRSENLAETGSEQRFLARVQQEIQERLAVHPERIGILLPLGSSSAALRELAQDTLDGLRLALQFPERVLGGGPGTPEGTVVTASGAARPVLPGGVAASAAQSAGPSEGAGGPSLLSGPQLPPYELVVRDTANNPRTAALLVEELVQREQVVAIIGPIARSESQAAAAKAEALGVPLISLSVTLELPEETLFVFRHSKSQDEEVRDLVDYAIDYLHAQRFAILFPETDFGRNQRDIFWDQTARKGGQVVAVSPYTPFAARSEGREALGFKEIFEAFTGVDRPVSPEEKKLIEDVGDSGPDPIVDFDALYLPIGPAGVQDLRLIAPYPVTVDAENVTLLGNRFWNDNAVLVAGEGKLEGAVFVDSFDRTRTHGKVEAFYDRHRAFFGHRPRYRPPSYYTGLGFDTLNMATALLEDRAFRGRRELARGLHAMAGYSGVTGWTTFKANGQAVKESMFFRLQGQSFVRLQP